jgi:hypothetical protein
MSMEADHAQDGRQIEMPHTFDATLKEMLSPDPVDLASAFGLPQNEPTP